VSPALAAADGNFLIPNMTFVVELTAFIIVLGVLWRYVIPPVRQAMNARQEMARKLVSDSEQASQLLHCIAGEATTWLSFTEEERDALAVQDHVALFQLGAHPFLTLTLFIAMFERDHAEPLGFQLEYAQRLSHFNMPYPDITT